MYLLCHYSDPHSVASLLVQQLLSHFSDTFLAQKSPQDELLGTGGGGGGSGDLMRAREGVRGASLHEFLSGEITLLLLISIHFISKQVPTPSHPWKLNFVLCY